MVRTPPERRYYVPGHLEVVYSDQTDSLAFVLLQ